MSIWQISLCYNSLVLLFLISLFAHLRNCQGQKKFTQKLHNCSDYGLTCIRYSECSNTQELINTKKAFTCGFVNDVQLKTNVQLCCSSSNIIITLAPTRNKSAVRVKPESSSIALQKCREYEKYKFVKKWLAPKKGGDEGYWYDQMECVNIKSLIVGGTAAVPREYPHMALIGYGNKSSEARWGCGGSLISERFILSAAHCGMNSVLGPPRWALLGDLTLSENTDDAKPINYTILRIYDHPKYAKPSYYYDISLFELSTDVKMSPYVRPACLHTSFTDLPIGTRASITGWGKTDTTARDPLSDKLLKTTVPVVEDGWCRNLTMFISESKLSHGYDSDGMICAGDLINGSDTCTGDSGGPIQTIQTTCMWNIIGITSFGSEICGDKENPAVYTRVAYYLDWIRDIVWP